MKKIFLLMLLLASGIAWGQQVVKDGFVINVEGSKIYIDLSASVVKNGYKLVVYAESGYMLHPVTKQRIKKELEACAEIQVIEAYKDYSVAKLISGQISDIKVGLKVRRQEQKKEIVNTLNTETVMTNTLDPVNKVEPKTSLLPKYMPSTNSSDKIRVVISPAEVNDVVGVGHFGGYVADILMEQLMQCDKVSLLDRSVLNTQMDELNLAGEYINSSTAIQKGRIVGAQYVIQVTMQKPDVVNIRTGIPLASIMGAIQGATGKNIGAQYASNAQVGTLKASVSITTRVVDLQTGEVVFMCSGTGKSQGKSQLSLEYGALGGGELNGGAEGFKQTITGKAIQQAFVTIGRRLNSFFNGDTDRKVMGSASGYGNYGQGMVAKGTRIYMGTEKLDKDGIQSAFSENPSLYFTYKKGKKLVRLSWLPIIAGALTGIGAMAAGEYEEDSYVIGGSIILVGIGSGVYMQIAGRNKIKKAVNAYNASQKYSYHAPCQLGVCLDNNGVGLRLTF